MSNIEWILIIIIIFLVILLFRYIQLKKQIRNLADQVNELNSGNSQQMLDISLIDKDLEKLAGILNQYNIRQRQAVAGVLRNEEYLKESVANISHDLRTPLTVILGHLQLLQKENLESSQAQRVKVIFSKAEKMKELVEIFYDLSILEEQQTVPEKEKFNISNMSLEIIYVFLTIFLYLLKCPQSLILSALRAFCFCGKPHISRSIFLYFRYQSWLKSW